MVTSELVFFNLGLGIFLNSVKAASKFCLDLFKFKFWSVFSMTIGLFKMKLFRYFAWSILISAKK